MAAYPRKQTVVIFAVCILIVGGVVFYVRGNFSGNLAAKSADAQNSNIVSVSAQESLPITTDWRKQFLGNNATSTSLKNSAVTQTSKQENLTATDLLGRSFLTKYAELQQSGLGSDQKSVENVMGQVTADALAGLPTPKTFSMASIRLSASSTTALADYGKTTVNAFAQYMPKQNEAEIANKALTDGDMSALSQIDPIIEGYKNLLSVLEDTPVPPPLAQFHIDLLNSLSMAINNAESIRHIDTDPLRGLSGVTSGLTVFQNIAKALYAVNDYMVSAGVRVGS